MLKDFKPRLYQETILHTCDKLNTLVILPTGLGKTAVALMLAAQRLKTWPDSKIVFLAPTKPLVEQHLATFKKYLNIEEEKMVVFTGAVSPAKRQKLWEQSKIIFSTPQGMENDLIGNKINIRDVSLIVFDEAHRGVGDYAYTTIAKFFTKKARHPRVLALTASPGTDHEKISEVCQNLFIEELEVRTDTDPDVEPYVQKIDARYIHVDLPKNFTTILKYLKDCYSTKIKEIRKYGFIHQKASTHLTKRELLGLQAMLHGEISHGNRDMSVLRSVSLAAEAMKVEHAVELLETQGVKPLFDYMEGIERDAYKSTVKAVKNLAKDLNFRSALIKTRALIKDDIKHPKINKLKEIVTAELENNPETRIIIFNHYRDSVIQVAQEINKIPMAEAKVFVGQAKKKTKGLSQKEQKEIIEKFREGIFNILIATSVAEEGLDIPAVDTVIFYEPVPSAIRHIQRRGRTGRLQKGRLIVLLAKGTRDEAYRWAAHHKEKRMYRILDELKNKITLTGGSVKTRLDDFVSKNEKRKREREDEKNKIEANEQQQSLPKPVIREDGKSTLPVKQETPQHTIKGNKPITNGTLAAFIDQNPDIKIYTDYREKSSRVVKELVECGATVNLVKLDAGDYILSRRVGVEYKTVKDLIDSIADGRLLTQIKQLKGAFIRPMVIIEGEEDMYSIRRIHPNAIRGMLATITVSYGIPVIQTRNMKETASMLAVIAKREQEQFGKNFSYHATKRISSDKEMQEYIVSSFPGIGASLAKPILKKFKTIKNFVNADSDEMKKIPLIGSKKSIAVKEIIDKEYEEI